MKRKAKSKQPPAGVAVLEQVQVWDDSIPKRAYRLCLLGLTNEELAVAFGVARQTINKWSKDHVQFAKALKYGRAEADSKVAQRLYQKATGYKKKEILVFVDKQGSVIEHEYEKEYTPDTTAAIFWLKNRQKDKWADVWKMEFTGTIDFQSPNNQLTDLTDEELKALQKYNIIQEMENFKNTSDADSSGR
jgi:DNA-binding XRE family transcriptional regulator